MTNESKTITRNTHRDDTTSIRRWVSGASVVALALLVASGDLLADNHLSQGLVDDRSTTRGTSGTQGRSRTMSLDEATSIVQAKHPGSRIVKVVRKKGADGRQLAKFRILTDDGRMKNITLPLN